MANTDLDSFWWVIVPETTINLVTNPSAETNLTGFTALGTATLDRVTTYQYRGFYSVEVDPPTSATQGVYQTYTLDASTQYTFSADIRGVDGETYAIDIYDVTAGSILGSALQFVSDGNWARYAVTATTGANTSIRVRVYQVGTNGGLFYTDGWQLEKKAYATEYIDGAMRGGIWAGAAHASTSTRLSQYAKSGRIVNLSDYDFPVVSHVGGGMANIEISSSRKAVGDGSNFRKQTLLDHQLQLTGVINTPDTATRKSLHATRSTLLSLLSPKRFATQQPVYFGYLASGKFLFTPLYNAGGGEASIVPEAGFTEETTMRFYTTETDWTRRGRIFNATDIANGIGTGVSGSSGAAGENGGGGGNAGQGDSPPATPDLTVNSSIANVDYTLQRSSDGIWSEPGTGLNLPSVGDPSDQINDIAIGPGGSLYITGNFTSVDGVSANRIAKWDGTSWSVLGSGLNGNGRSLAFDSSGNLYVSGDFTIAGGVTVNYVAKWDGSSWSALGSGISTFTGVGEVAVDSNNDVYVTGDFTTAGGVSANHIAKWNGSSWSALGSGLNDSGAVIVFDDNNNLYVGGFFTTAGGVSAGLIAKWNGSSWSALGSGLSGSGVDNVSGLAFDDDENLYASGVFDTAGGNSVNNIAKWNGSSWSALGSGLDSTVSDVLFVNGYLYATGFFLNSGSVSVSKIARWDGSSWSALGSGLNDTSGSASGSDLAVDSAGNLYVGGFFDQAGSLSISYLAKWNGTDWRTIATATKSIIQAFDRTIYYGGGFINAGGIANADRIAAYDPSADTWSALGTGADGVVHDIAEAPNGDIYITGSFDSVNSVANTAGIAYWDGSAWNALSTGLTGTGLALTFDNSGNLFVGGIFTDAGGVSDTANLAKWDGSSWTAVSSEPNGAVNDLHLANNGTIYIGGAFTKIGATSYSYIANYDPDADTFSACSTGTNGFVNSITQNTDGMVYLTGTFTTAGGITVNYVAQWNGTTFNNMSSGLNNVGYVIEADESTGKVYIGGVFTEASGLALPDKVTVWNGSSFTPIAVDLPGDAAVEALLFEPTGEAWIGFDTSGTATAAAVN